MDAGMMMNYIKETLCGDDVNKIIRKNCKEIKIQKEKKK